MSQFNEMQSEGTHEICKRLMHLLLEMDERLSQLNDCMYSLKDEQYKANQDILQRLTNKENKVNNVYTQTVYVSSNVSKQTEGDLSTFLTPGSFTKQLQSTTKQNDAIQDEDKTSTNGNIARCEILISDDGNEEKQCKTLPDVPKEINSNRSHELEFLHDTIEKQELEGMINYDDYVLSDFTNEIGEFQRESVKNHAGEEENNLSLSEGHLDIPPMETRNTKAPEFTLDEMSPEDFEYSNCLSQGDDDNATVHEITELPDGKNVTDISKRAQKEPRGETDSNISSDELKILDIAGLPGTTPIKRAIESALHNDNVYLRSDRGLDTVVCVDTSASTGGKYFDQIKSTLYSFIDAVEENVVATGLEENISIVTIGAQTKVLQPLTNDYGVLRDKVESLTCSGTSPILTALLLCYLIIKKEGNAISICGYNVPARIILITDGRPTDDAYMDNLSLEYAPKDPRIQKKIETLTQQLTVEGCQLFTVNVGRSSNTDFLESLAMLSGGKSFGLDDMRYLSQYFLYQYFAGKVIKICRENQYEDKYQEIVTAEIERLRCKHFDEQDKKNIIELIEASQELMYREYPGLPHLGARISLSLSDVQSTGTVVQHRDSGWIKIKLDAQGYYLFHYQTNVDDLTIIDEPLRLRSNQIMAVGVKVVSEEGVVGTVFETTDVGFIRVAWDNGTKERIEYASVKIHGSSSSSSSSS